jgi:hypothetical protein
MPVPLPEELLTPHPERLLRTRRDYALILERHAAAVAANRESYVDPATGHQVFTARVLWERGYCCDLGCRHCPWIPR